MDFNQILDLIEDFVVLLFSKLSTLDMTSIDSGVIAEYASKLGPFVHDIVAAVGEIISGWF